jgi:hypothetical protein
VLRCLYLFLDPEGPSVSVVCDSRGTMNLPATADFASCEAQVLWSDRSRVQRGRKLFAYIYFFLCDANAVSIPSRLKGHKVT